MDLRPALPHEAASHRTPEVVLRPSVGPRWWTVALALTSVMSGALAQCAPQMTPETSAAEREREAAKLYQEGVAEAKARRWDHARALILKSFALVPTPAKAANLGRVELTAGKPRDAADHLVYFLREEKGITADDRRATIKMLGEAEAKIGTVTIQAEAGADLFVDGQAVGKAPLADPVFVDAGTRRFEAKKAGAAASQDVYVMAGSAPVVALRLVAPGTGRGGKTGAGPLTPSSPGKTGAQG